MKRWQWLLVGLMGMCLVIGVGFWLTLSNRKNIDVDYNMRGLPVIDIGLNGIEWNELTEGEKTIRYPDNNLAVYDQEAVTMYTGVEIKGRGNMTWSQPKKPLQITLAQSADLLRIGRAKQWVLLTNYLDASYLRSDTAMMIAEMVGEQYATRGKFVELYASGDYQGLYYLLKKNVIRKGVLDLRDQMGVLVELDNLHHEGESCYYTYEGNCLVLKDAVSYKNPDDASMAMTEFVTDFNQLEIAAKVKDYVTVEKLADIESLAKYYLISEFTVNPDAYSSSFYWYKDGKNDKIHAGPVWDFDLAFGNRQWVWATNDEFFSPLVTMARRSEVLGIDNQVEDAKTSKIIYYLMETPEFQAEVERIFQDKMQGRKWNLIIEIWRVANLIRRAALADAEYWERDDYDAAVNDLIRWIYTRYQYMEREYGGV